MSIEQDKDSFSLKRNRGGDGGLDILGGPGLLLGSPEKKRRKSSTQAPSFSPLSEYAPPPNPSADHLIASNPFDDNYNSPSLKALPPASPYFGHSHYPVFSGYGPPRMSSRMPSPYGAPYQMRNQPHPFSQNPMGYNRALGFNYGHPENPNYGQLFSGGGNSVMHFRPNPGEHVSLQNLNQIASPGGLVFSPEGNPARDLSPNQQNNFTQSSTPTPKQVPSEAMNKSATQNQNCEENKTQDDATELKTKSGAEKLNGVLHGNNEALKKSPRPAGNNGALTNNKALNRRSTSSSSEPVYPCGICLSEVNDDQEAILCEASCQKWFHRVCTGMTETAYNLLTAETSAVWGCDACMEDKGAQLLKTRERDSRPGDGQS
ncbi:pygopus homolog 1-like [Sinocyclocheilus rhinocerous]|uniref:Pygopus homolog 1-like n=1 Tax=Sinocyclocheilus rhinocerous TaxID=307959 RepID=A0A673FGM0_9TELE|nr:PREDICTED: pygopus homolog 1-like [Sinocyclocheilus rhinocerous]